MQEISFQRFWKFFKIGFVGAAIIIVGTWALRLTF